jgi:hypothetical protein
MLRDRNPQHWKLLIFYCNPGEPRLFVAKRSGLPLTLNFAKPMAWAITATALALVAAVAILNNAHFIRSFKRSLTAPPSPETAVQSAPWGTWRNKKGTARKRSLSAASSYVLHLECIGS